MLLLVSHLFALSWFALTNPTYIWDVVPYVATTFTAELDDPEAVHGATYGLLQQSLDAAQFNALIGGEYAATMYTSPQHFTSQLKMYEIKPLYVLALRGLSAVGTNPVHSIIWLSLVPSLLICMILYLWLRNLTGPMQAVLAVILFSLSARMFDLSQGPVPDSFNALVVVAGLWFLLARRSAGSAVVCLCISIWIRTNNILFIAPLFLLLCWSHLHRNKTLRSEEFYWYSAGLTLSVLSYLWINTIFDYNWWRLFYHTLIEYQVDIESFSEPFSLTTYLDVLRDAAFQLLSRGGVFPTVLPLFLLIFLITWAGNWRSNVTIILKPAGPISLTEVSMLCLPVFGAFLVLFPLIPELDRFLTPYYAIITLYAVSCFSKFKIAGKL